MVCTQHRIRPRKWDEQNSLGFWDTDGSTNLGQTTIRSDSQQHQHQQQIKRERERERERERQIQDFDVPVKKG